MVVIRIHVLLIVGSSTCSLDQGPSSKEEMGGGIAPCRI